MAKGNLILGTMSGKLGDVVAYNYNGKQAARVRRRTIANPKSAKQAIQRTIAASVAKFVSAFAPVLNNSLQSEQTKVKTLAKIRGLNMNFLRQLAAQELGTYCPKGAMFVAPNDYLISRGTLTGLTPNKSKTESVLLTRGAIALDASQFNIEEYGPIHHASYHFPTIAVGDQITVLASATEDVTEGSKNGYCRFAFKDDTTQAFINSEGSLRKLNPAAIDTSKAAGDWQNLRFAFLSDADGDFGLVFFGALVGESADSPLASACSGVIVSREAGKLRSTAHMVSIADYDWSLDDVYPTYMDGGTAIDMPSENYLDNDAVVVVPPFLNLLNPDGTTAVMPLTRQISSTEAGMFKFSSQPATRFNIYIDYVLAGQTYTAQIDQASSATVGDITWRYTSSNTVTAEGKSSASIEITKVRYRDYEGHDITWD